MKWLKLIGLIFDLVGTFIIGIAVVHFHQHIRDLYDKEKVKEQVFEEMHRESITTIVGIAFVFVGFLCIFGEEIYDSYILKRHFKKH